MSMGRTLEAEWLDELPHSDPRAIDSRRDLRWINWLMGHRRIVRKELALLIDGPASILELGAGDGTLMLAVAQDLRWPSVKLTLLDRHHLVSHASLNNFAALGWNVEVAASDVFVFLQSEPSSQFDIVFANLFLHHLSAQDLVVLFNHVSQMARIFVAVEPRRSPIALVASRSLWMIGANDVTRHDAPASVRAGFDGTELSRLWPSAPGWEIREQKAGLFSHSFVARFHG